MRQTSSLFQTQLLPVSGMSQQAHRGEKRKLQLKEGKKGGGIPPCAGRKACLSTISLWALHPHSLQNTWVKATQPGGTQHHSILRIHTVVTPQLHLIFPTDKTCKSLVTKKKENRRIWPIKLRFICDLAAFTDWNPSPSTSTAVSPPLGYQMCLAQFGMRHTQINNLLWGATVESPRWVSKTNILSFICIARSPLMAALMLLYVLALDPHTRLWPGYNVPKVRLLCLRKEWDWIFGQPQTHMILLSHKQ